MTGRVSVNELRETVNQATFDGKWSMVTIYPRHASALLDAVEALRDVERNATHLDTSGTVETHAGSRARRCPLCLARAALARFDFGSET